MFLPLSLVLFGAAAAGLGWYWTGLTQAKTSSVAIGAPGLVLLGLAIFDSPDSLPVWAYAATTVGFIALAAAMAYWGIGHDTTLGFFALFYTMAAALSTAGYSNAADEFNIYSLALLVSTLAGALVLLTAMSLPGTARKVAGWFLVMAGFGVAFLAYAPSINVSF